MSGGLRDIQQVQQRRDQIHTAEQIVVNHWGHCHPGGRADDHRDTCAGLVQGGFRSGEGRTVVGDEHHPRAGVQSGGGKRVQYPADRGVGGRDGSVEVGQILAHLNGIGQIVGRIDSGGVGRFVAIPRIRAVRFEEAGRQQKWSAGVMVAQPLLSPFHHIFAVGVRYVELVETQPRRVGCLVLHSEKGRVPTIFSENLRQCTNARAILPTMVGQPDQSVALRVAASEQRSARR